MNQLSSAPNLGKWKIVKHIASGSTASVYQGYNPETNAEAAIKIYNYSSDVTPELMNGEKEIMENLSHPNVIEMYEFLEDIDFEDCRGCLFKVSGLVVENASAGNIFDLIESVGSLPEALSRTFFHQLIDAIEYLHGKNIAHRDIKPENLLLSSKFCLKLADFGYAVDLNKSSGKSRAGTSQYLAPEIHADRNFDPKDGDLFAAAIMLFCMISGSMPFNKATECDKLYKYVIEGDLEKFWGFHEAVANVYSSKQVFTEDLKDLFARMFNPDPKQRLSIKDIKKHPWYQKDNINEDKLEFFVRELLKY